jgi:hypothetical protein
MRTLLLAFIAVALSGTFANAQPFQTLGRSNPETVFFYERTVPNTSVDVTVLRERSLRWLQKEFGTRAFDTATLLSPDTIRSYGYLPLRRGDGLRNISASFRVRMMPSTAGIYLLADNFRFTAYDVVNGERYDIPFEEATDYFEGNNLSATRDRFDERFASAVSTFDRLTVEPRTPPNADGAAPATQP